MKDTLKETRNRVERIKDFRVIDNELLSVIDYVNQEIARQRRWDLKPIKRF